MTTVDESFRENWAKMLAEAEASRTSSEEGSLKGGSGGGTFDGMEARVARLEADIEHVKKGMDRVDSGVVELKKSLAESRLESAKMFGELKATLGSIDERSKHLPTRWEVFIILATAIAVVGGIVALTARFLPAG